MESIGSGKYISTGFGGTTRRRGPRIGRTISEVHSLDTAVMNGTNMHNGGEVSYLTLVPHGSTMHQRDGREIKVSGMDIRGLIRGGSTQTGPIGARILICVDSRPRGAAPAATDILEACNAYSLYQDKYLGRFRILWDYVVPICGDGDTLTGSYPVVLFEKKLRFRRPIRVVYNEDDTTGTSANTLENLIVTLVCSSGANDTTSPNGHMNVRMYYSDI